MLVLVLTPPAAEAGFYAPIALWSLESIFILSLVPGRPSSWARPSRLVLTVPLVDPAIFISHCISLEVQLFLPKHLTTKSLMKHFLFTPSGSVRLCGGNVLIAS